MVIDLERCVGCYACTMACKVENGTPAGMWYAPVYEKEIGTYPAVKRMFLPTLCNHRNEAPCMKACPTRAIHKRQDGIVLVDKDKCCGSRACVAACPYGALSDPRFCNRKRDLWHRFLAELSGSGALRLFLLTPVPVVPG